MRVSILSVVPSPYQRDLFRALHRHPAVDLDVHYLEEAAPDSPWPKVELEPWERVLPGRTLGRRRVRCHVNWRLPDFDRAELVIINAALTAWTTQEVMRRRTREGKPWVFWGERLRERSGVYGAVQNQLVVPLRRADAVVAVGTQAQRDFQYRLPQTPVYQIPYHCDIDPFLNTPRFTNNRHTTFLFCGQMIPRKGIDLLLEAFSRLHGEHPQTRLILAGREAGIQGRLKNLSPDCQAAIDLRGFVAPQDLPKLFADADVFVLPSRHDGWGVVINQALASGLPTIATYTVGAATDLISSGKEGFLIEPGCCQSLEQAMNEMVGDPGKRSFQSKRARKRGQQLHPDFGAAHWVNIFDRILTQTQPALSA